jgi:phosphoglycolate phosphatase-like HAD superfamily hydrolase
MHICFLDIDGTLVLTGGAGQAAFARTLAEDFGIAQIDGRVQFAGRSDRAIAMDLFRSHAVVPSDENWMRFRAGYLARLEEALVTHQGVVLPGVEQLLAGLQARGDVALGLLTGNLREGAHRKLGHYGLWHHFPFGGFGDEYLERCDIAAAALAAARQHLDGHADASGSNGVAAARSEVIVIGDTPHDIACGRSIGARCVAVPTGNTPAAVLHAARPDVFVDTLEDLAPILALLDGAPS